MKSIYGMRFAVAGFAIAIASANFASAQDCLDDPEACAGPRSWREDFDEDPLDTSPDDWQQRGASTLPEYEDGRAILDGTLSAWTLLDTADHFFEGVTTIHIKMDANPAEEFDDRGAGWWLNADNEGNQGGFYAIYGVLTRFDEGEQEYRFGPDRVTDEVVEVADGPIDVMVTLTPNEDEEELHVAYSITDIVETHTGEFSIVGREGPGTPREDRWFTLFSNGNGQGIVDFVEVINQPETGDPCDYDGDGVLGVGDLNLLSAAIAAGGTDAKFDVNGDGAVDVKDLNFYVTKETKLHSWIGDANLDGEFNSGDFVQVFTAGLYESGEKAGWGEGDWDANLTFDSGDFVAAFTDGGYELGPRTDGAAAAVPEPAGIILLLTGWLALMRRLR